MSRSANAVAVGGFVLITIVLLVALLLLFSGSNWWSPRDRYVLIFDSSIKGLNVGAPVTIKGVKIGQVEQINASLYGKSMEVLNQVVIEIDAEALELEDNARPVALDQLVDRGLRAQLRLQSFLTGLLYVDVDFAPDREPQYRDVETRYPQLPTTPTDLQQLTRDLEDINITRLGQDLQEVLAGANRLINDPDLQNLAGDLRGSLAALEAAARTLREQGEQFGERYGRLADNANTFLDRANRELPAVLESLDATLAALSRSSRKLEESAANAAFLTSSDSPVLHRVNDAARSVDSAANQLRRLTEMLERQPQSLIYGRPDEE
jgi:paraquat-inducible protein B